MHILACIKKPHSHTQQPPHTQSSLHCRPHDCHTSLVLMPFQMEREIPLNLSLKILIGRRKVWTVKQIFHISALQTRGRGVWDVKLCCTHSEVEKRWYSPECFIFSGFRGHFPAWNPSRCHNKEARGTKKKKSPRGFKVSLPLPFRWQITLFNFEEERLVNTDICSA